MIQIGLHSDEAEVLQSMLEGCLSDLRVQLRHTDNRDYRHMLKQQEALLKKILQRLDAQPRDAATALEPAWRSSAT
jgi:hypothetical protein